jgi:hypothetical protein
MAQEDAPSDREAAEHEKSEQTERGDAAVNSALALRLLGRERGETTDEGDSPPGERGPSDR